MTMRHVAMAAALLLAAPTAGAAQEGQRAGTPEAAQLPRAAAREVARLYGEPHALRGHGRTEVRAGAVVEGNASVIDGPLIITGRVNGRVLAINSDVILQPGARIDGDLLVVGGDVEGAAVADVAGEIRVYRESLRFTRDGEQIVIAEPAREPDDDSWWRRWERRREAPRTSRLAIASAGPYNRVEGLPVHVGPSLRLSRGATRLSADAFAVFRTGSSFRSDSNDVGYHLAAEVRRPAIRVVHVTRLSAAIDRLAEGGVDVVLLDLSLPDSFGLETFAKVYAHSPTVPIIVLTARDETPRASRFEERRREERPKNGARTRTARMWRWMIVSSRCCSSTRGSGGRASVVVVIEAEISPARAGLPTPCRRSGGCPWHRTSTAARLVP